MTKYKTKYKSGDKVVVRKDLELDHRYYMLDSDIADTFVPGMDDYCGSVVTIKRVYHGKYEIMECGWNWTDEMFEEIEKIIIQVDMLMKFLV